MAIANATTVRLHNVVVATDFFECSERALRHGLATARHFGATVHLLNLIRPSTYAIVGRGVLPEVSELAHRDGSKLIAKLKTEGRLGDLEHRTWVLEGEVPDVLPDFVRENGIDLIVIGTHGRTGVPKFLFGSVAQQVFEYASCPVLTVGPYSPRVAPRMLHPHHHRNEAEHDRPGDVEAGSPTAQCFVRLECNKEGLLDPRTSARTQLPRLGSNRFSHPRHLDCSG